LDHNKLYTLNADNYEPQTETMRIGRKLYSRQIIARKKTANGQSVDDIDDPDGELHKKLTGESPNNYYVIFWARPDSFELFLKARHQAEQDGYSVGWHPFPRAGILSPSHDVKAEEQVRKR
jgi:hypothetical protein